MTSGVITSLTSTTGTISNLYSNILAVNNNNIQRATNDIFEVCTTSSTGNYLYYNNTSVFGHINTSNSASSWFIDSNGLAKITKLSLNSTSRSTNDLFIFLHRQLAIIYIIIQIVYSDILIVLILYIIGI